MNYSIKTTSSFDKEAKRLNKRYASFKDDLTSFISELKNNPELGSDLGRGIRKIRMKIKSKCRGKSGGARIITLNAIISEQESLIYLLFIYDKSERSTISSTEIDELIKQLTEFQ